MGSSGPKKEIDMSLRLWSELVPLGPIVEQLDVTASCLHVINDPIMTRKGRVGQLAKRHYASIENIRVQNDSEVTTWCHQVVGKINSRELIVDLLGSDQIEALLWIAMFGSDPAPIPNIQAGILDAAAKLKLGILIENYTVLRDGVPEKTWLLRSE